MEKQKTAVEWLIKQFKEKLTGSDLPEWVLGIINQAKEMEKEQLEDSYCFGILDSGEDGLGFNHYYNETYGDEKHD